MGHLLQILLAVGVQAAVESGFERDGEAPFAVLALLCLPHLLAFGARWLALRGRFARANALARLLVLSPALLQLAALGLFGWRRSVSRWVGEEVSLLGWPSPALLLVFLPFVLYALASFDARARLRAEVRAARRSIVGLQARMFGAALAPLTAYVLASAALGRSFALRVRVEELSVWSTAYSLIFFALLALFLPRVLRASFDTAPLASGPLRELLEEVGRRARFRCRELYVWRTGNQMPNAAIVGFWPSQRFVVFSDSLLAMLHPRELVAVYAHEIGHAVRRHVPIFLCWTAGFFLGADLLASELDPEGGLLALGALAAALLVWYLGFGWLSRRFELDADLFSIELLGEGESLSSALEAVGGNLRDVASWRHFSVGERSAFLRRAAQDPGFALRFRARVRRLALAGGLLLAGMALLHARELARAFPAQASVADLRLGRTEAALARVAQLEQVDRQLVARRAAAEAAALLEEAPEQAADWLALGARAGDARLERVGDALALGLAGRADQARARIAQSEPEWWELLERGLRGRAGPAQ